MRLAGMLPTGLVLLALVCCACPAMGEPGRQTVPSPTAPSTELTGPWRFQIGDDPRWAAPDFDDSTWESVDLTPAADAHDGDVGLPGYVAGWRARGHSADTGFAWYRLAVTVDAGRDVALALAGPTLVDSTYQLYVDGRLVGGPGDFSGPSPRAYSVRPSMFMLPASTVAGPRTYQLALRVWMDPADAAGDSGGVHVAPTIGRADAIALLHQVQWLRTFKGYVVDALEPLAFLLLAILLSAMARGHEGRLWLVLALLLLALLRVNQVTYAWTPWQSLRCYDIATAVVLRPLVLSVWLVAWCRWFGVPLPSRWPLWLGILLVAHVGCALAARPWFMPGMAEGLRHAAEGGMRLLRLLHLLLYIGVIAAGLYRRPAVRTWLTALAALLVGVGLFSSELSALGVPGIWFPYGTGVARGQFAYAGFIVIMFALLLMLPPRMRAASQVPAVALDRR